MTFFLELINSLKSLISQNIEMDFNISAHALDFMYDTAGTMQMEHSPQFVIISAWHYDNAFPR